MHAVIQNPVRRRKSIESDSATTISIEASEGCGVPRASHREVDLSRGLSRGRGRPSLA
ncbi:protein of unknown function [Bradyrhizobium sp. ORS 285]|nr:hypothetical protein BRAO285_240010 [Bradyrhizobium sp. ORS 285]SMX60654.1 protein of unknown function [Bradyrhizobium sp. ORS 285]